MRGSLPALMITASSCGVSLWLNIINTYNNSNKFLFKLIQGGFQCFKFFSKIYVTEIFSNELFCLADKTGTLVKKLDSVHHQGHDWQDSVVTKDNQKKKKDTK